MQNPKQLQVFYDGGCPICRLEVDLYERHDKADNIEWIDINSLKDQCLPSDKSREERLGKFHVRENKDGNWHIGVDAFARIWADLPVWRRFAFVFSVPGIRQLAEIGYRGFLKWQRWHRQHRNNHEQAVAD